MAIIKCVKCGNDVSDKAEICPHCGFSVAETLKQIDSNEDSKNGESNIVGDELSNAENDLPKENEDLLEKVNEPENEIILSKEYSNNLDENVKKTNSNNIGDIFKKIISDKKKLGILIAIIVVIIIGIILLVGGISKGKYVDNMREAQSLMLTGGVDAETACNQIKSVWYNAIFDKNDSETVEFTRGASDFNEALQNLFASSAFSSQIADIEANQVAVDAIMDDLKNPPAKYEKCYDALLDLYNDYITLTKMATDPSGNLNIYNSEFSSADSDMVESYNTVSNLLPSED